MRINRFFYLIKEGFKGVFSHGFRSFASISIIVACLFIMGSFALLSLNVDYIIDDLESQSEILAFVEENYTDEEARALETNVLSVENVREVIFVSREEAMENYKSQYEDATLFENIDASVFRDRYVIFLNDITQMEATKGELLEITGIADVNAYIELAEGFVTVRNVVSAITVVLIVILLIVSMFIMANTIKLATVTRREEIAIMKMVGASNGFIRLPFIIEGMLIGLIGGFVAFGLQWIVYNVVSNRIMTSIAGSLINTISFDVIRLPLMCVCVAVGFVVGVFGGSIAIRNYLKV